MIVVDSSAFIEFYRPNGRPEVRETVAEWLAADKVAVNGIIQTEVVSFAKGIAAYEKLRDDFKAFHWLDLTRRIFDRAAEMGYELRTSGVTVPATDLIIASSSMAIDAELYHLDRHFELIAKHFELAHRSFIVQ